MQFYAFVGILSNKTGQAGITSPMPFLIRLRNLVFGRRKPDVFTRIAVYVNLLIWFVFATWSAVSYVALSFRRVLFESKHIPIDAIIKMRGVELGFDPDVFLKRILTFHAVSVIAWAVIFAAIVFMWRKKSWFVYLIFLGWGVYLGMELFYLGIDYFRFDTTTFDKIALLVMLMNSVLYYFLLSRERSGATTNIFTSSSDE